MLKLKDIIVPFTSEGSYQVDVGLMYLENTLRDYTEDYGLELNPDFQRGAVWTEAQQIAFVEYFLRGGTSSKIIYFNCGLFGGRSSGRGVDDFCKKIVCVDGLQRLTALRKFIANELPVFGHYLNEFEDARVILRGSSIKFNVNNLKTRKEVIKWYLDLNTGGTVHSDEEINRVKELLALES